MKGSDVSLCERIARGAEGEVWSGKMGDSPVAIKVLVASFGDDSKQVWTEGEVAAMMMLQHPRLVQFIGAGDMIHPHHGCRFLFTVQELMTGGSLDKRLWGQPYTSVTWAERLQWASDVALRG